MIVAVVYSLVFLHQLLDAAFILADGKQDKRDARVFILCKYIYNYLCTPVRAHFILAYLYLVIENRGGRVGTHAQTHTRTRVHVGC